MRNKTANNIADTWFWYLIYAMPFLCYIIACIRFEPTTIVDYFNTNLGIVFSSTNVIYTTLTALFGSDGFLTLFGAGSTALVYICTWFICCMVFHLVVDLVLFIPRLAHKWIGKVTE